MKIERQHIALDSVSIQMAGDMVMPASCHSIIITTTTTTTITPVGV